MALNLRALCSTRKFVAAEADAGRLDPRVGPLLEAAVLF
jgi:hypothetical protein